MQNSRARLLRDKTPNPSLADVKARQSSKIREIGEALITAGFVSLNAQAKVFGLPRSTAWTILSAKHKGTGLSARIIYRMLSSGELNANGKRPNGSPGGEILNEWHTQHGRRWPAWQCAGCGKMIGGLEGDDSEAWSRSRALDMDWLWIYGVVLRSLHTILNG